MQIPLVIVQNIAVICIIKYIIVYESRYNTLSPL